MSTPLSSIAMFCLCVILAAFAIMFAVFAIVILTAVISTLAEKVRCWKRERKAKK